MKTHELKLDVKYFDDIKNGKKNFEIRKNDRNYQVGDILDLKAWDPSSAMYVGEYNECVHHYHAKTLKVKVVSIFKPKTINAKKYLGRGYRDENSSVYIVNDDVFKTLREYFDTDRLPVGYVVLGIEVFQ